MGFHIVNIEDSKLKHDYVETYEELSFVEFITDHTIIYQGEEHWKPVRVIDSEHYKNFAKGSFRAGIQAQEIFKEQATSSGYILEMLNQDQKSFKSYTKNVNSISIKRGDFLIRNFGNIEIDVKCYSFKTNKGIKYFNFNYENAIKHRNMQCFTNAPVLIAVYENVLDRPVEEIIYMFSIDDLMNSNEIEIINNEKHEKWYRIPLSFTTHGFSLIDAKFSQNFSKPSICKKLEDKTNTVKKGYLKWTTEEDEKLEDLFCKEYTIAELSKAFGRNNGAIRSRINKLELKKNWPITKSIP